MALETFAFARRDDVDVLGDLYRPHNGNSAHRLAPIIIAVHGGGWRRGHRQDLTSWGEFLSAAGLGVFSIDYATSESAASYPANVDDVRAAIAFVRSNGAKLGFDANRIGGLGASAGAHLLSLAALTDAANPIQALSLAYGVYDLARHWQADQRLNNPPGEDLTERMLGAPPPDDPSRARSASPLTHTHAARGQNIMLIWGDTDDVVLPIQSEIFAQALTEAGAHVETTIVPNAGHFWFSREPIEVAGSRAGLVAPDVVRFFQQHLAAS